MQYEFAYMKTIKYLKSFTTNTTHHYYQYNILSLMNIIIIYIMCKSFCVKERTYTSEYILNYDASAKN